MSHHGLGEDSLERGMILVSLKDSQACIGAVEGVVNKAALRRSSWSIPRTVKWSARFPTLRPGNLSPEFLACLIDSPSIRTPRGQSPHLAGASRSNVSHAEIRAHQSSHMRCQPEPREPHEGENADCPACGTCQAGRFRNARCAERLSERLAGEITGWIVATVKEIGAVRIEVKRPERSRNR